MIPIRNLVQFWVMALLLAVGGGSEAQSQVRKDGSESHAQGLEHFSLQGWILVPDHADSVELRAAHLLADHLDGFAIIQESAADTLPSLRNPGRGAMPMAVFVGNTRMAKGSLSRTEELRDDGFRLRSDGHTAIIYGPQDKAVYYGAARLLELKGFRMTDHRVPDVSPSIVPGLPIVDEVNNPSFAYREIWYYTPHHSPAYADWHGLHRRIRVGPEGQYIDDKQSAGPLRWADGMYVHTFQKLIPPATYFDRHPEWFSEIGGQRVRDGQLCLSNPQVLDTLCANLATMMKHTPGPSKEGREQQPDARIWSVSNNDNYNVCQCPRCRHADSLYGGPSGTLIHFINQVARRFPDKTISTLAYQFTRRVPQPVGGHVQKPDSNVNIMFCSIECGRQEAIATAPAEASFRRDMEEWAKLTHNIYVWDYVVQFRNMWDPFPNLHVLQPNLKYFHDHGVRLMFEQGTGANNMTSWMELRQYMLAKLLWDVDADPDSLLHDFCLHHYGLAAAPVEQFYREMHRSLIASGQRLDIYGYPVDAATGYLSPTQISLYQTLIAAAYDSLALYNSRSNPFFENCGLTAQQVVRDRIRYLELSLDYAILELTMSGFLPMDSSFSLRADRFVADGSRLGLTILHEMGYSLHEYRADIDNYLAKCSQPNLARHRPVTLRHLPHSQYSAGGPQGLTDGRAGILNYKHDWLGFWGDTLDAVIDLGRRHIISQVKLDFFYFPLSWIFFPQTVNYYISTDGRRWNLVGTLRPDDPQRLAVPQIKTFAARFPSRRVRYVRVEAVPLPSIPAWHRATGSSPWLFTDEIIVR